jgi:hypothetical protein
MALATVAAYGCGGSAADGTAKPPTNPQDGPPAGYSDGHAAVPVAGQVEDVSSPTSFETPDLPGFYVIAKNPAQIINSQVLR